MVSRHLQNNDVAVEQPVKFYKFIAVTFLIITLILFGVIIFMSSKRAVITVITKSQPIDITSSVKIGNAEKGADVSGSVTSTVMNISETFEPTGTAQEEGVATGKVTLHNESSLAQPLVATTRLMTKDGVLFRMKQAATVPASGTVEVLVYADKPGDSGDIGPQEKFTIPGLSEVRQEEVYGSSEAPMKGGVKNIGILSLDDIKNAENILLEKITKQAEESLQSEHPEQKGIFSVIQHTFESDVEAGKQVSQFTLSGKATVMGVFYSDDAIQSWAAEALSKRAISDVEIVHAGSTQPTVTFEKYNDEDHSVTAKVFYDGLATLNPESPAIQKGMFLGKTKAEIRRYLIGLDHIYEVNIDFSPAWMRKVPFMAEHVTVVVKNVE
ncbi:MAG: hypothetical protein COV59_01195 [Candidatus Magasanikbacteria bacterium CG11_big_fil_rev_8_21_14_0_20_39_34]|uniref:Baseplate protein J-like barrel domain-containing protein n=1 Tax=Candidatus Magasanikbacteria bacterium CG11_big_fil_rev_8_21_14_0_20_39_34 TaxID=1974653 RepID=A0A2H0N8I0_9BACT|nr:MAG: hypothetical protein COV59_01195 [Candidatus Magasanikbacteria bacterium CG11_big_fil_rev_8_21_14_0_20_39_34]